jgi:hypothetical protein
MTLATFLDRLMVAESGGQDAARNPRSTAVGPFQFIEETFLGVVRRHFGEETRSLSTVALLELRQDRAFARRAAEAYSKDNAARLAREGLATSFTIEREGSGTSRHLAITQPHQLAAAS